jgi:hypothetical protein
MSQPGLSGCPVANSQLPDPRGDLGDVKACCDVPLVNGECPNTNDRNRKEKICIIGDTGTIQNDWYRGFITSTFSQCEMPGQPRVETVFEETIPLPNIPFQKWTFVTIAREGRRFDVYYNGKLVMSKRTQNIVDTRSAVSPIVAGDPALTGTITRVESFPEKLTQPQIAAKYSEQADTTGKPHMESSMNLLDYLPGCKGGGCLTGPSVRPTSPLLDWETPYA